MSTMEILVKRGPEGGLGIEVDETNTVASCAGQPELVIGDRVVAVDGVSIQGYLAQVLPKQAEYKFTVERREEGDAASLEAQLERLTVRARAGFAEGLDGVASDEVLTAKIEGLAAALEAKAPPPADAAAARQSLQGFWKLVFASGELASGLTGFGQMPLCYVAGHFQAFTEQSPPAQVVEVIGDGNLRTSNVAALKGDYELRGTPDGLVSVAATYDRLEYGGSMQSADVLSVVEALTYVGGTLRLGRCEGELRIYERCDAAAAQEQIGRLMMAPVRSAGGRQDAAPRWERADLERGLRGPGPEAQTGGTMM